MEKIRVFLRDLFIKLNIIKFLDKVYDFGITHPNYVFQTTLIILVGVFTIGVGPTVFALYCFNIGWFTNHLKPDEE